MSFSRNSYLTLAAAGFGLIGTGFGLNAIFRPIEALSVFELPAPALEADRQLVKILSVVYGIRDVFMGASIFIVARYTKTTRDPRPLGWLLLAAGACPVADGLACKLISGVGEWNHWSYAWLPLAIGASLLGLFD